MKIALISANVTKPGSGRSTVVPLALSLKRKGQDVYIIDVSAGFSSETINHATNIPIIKVGPWSGVSRHPTASLNFVRDKIRHRRTLPWMTALELRRILDKLSVDVVYVFSNYNVLPLLLGGPSKNAVFVINLIGFGISADRGGQENTFWLQQEIFARPLWDVHVCATDFEYNGYRQIYDKFLLSPKKLMVLPHSYDEQVFYSGEAKQRKVKQIVYPVAVYPRKNIEMLIEISAELNEVIPVNVIITGPIIDQRYYKYLKELAEKLKMSSRIAFGKGELSSKGLGDLLRETDLIVFPSFQETFGIGIAEGLACGTPVLVPDDIPALGQFRQLPGINFSRRDVSAFVKQAISILGNPAWDREEISLAVKTMFSNDAVANNFLKACYRAINVKQSIASLDWESFYLDKPFGDRLFSERDK